MTYRAYTYVVFVVSAAVLSKKLEAKLYVALDISTSVALGLKERSIYLTGCDVHDTFSMNTISTSHIKKLPCACI